MKIVSSYSVKIKHYNNIFRDTLSLYRKAEDFFIQVCLSEWDGLLEVSGDNARQRYIETRTHKTKKNPEPKFDFDAEFYKFPSYLRRSAISAAIGLVSSYKSNLAAYEADPKGGKPGIPHAGHEFPVMYRDSSFIRTGTYTARIKVFIRNTWDWLDVELKKGDVDYILRWCGDRTESAPTLCKRGKQWFLHFAYTEYVKLRKTPLKESTALAVDLGVNNACTCSVMRSDGTILARKFLSLPREEDSLARALNKIKKAQQHGAAKTPRLWARAKGLSDDIAVKTAAFIIETATAHNADVIVFEHLDLSGKKRRKNKKQRLHHWRAQYVQSMVEHKAHRLGMRISRVCAWGTSKLAYDGSGPVERGIDGNYSICKFTNGKIYNCDLSASYNIGARYFIRETLKSLSEKKRLDIEAKVPQCSKRITCTLSTLLSLNAALPAPAGS